MKTYPNLTPGNIAEFEQYARENNLSDWTISIRKDMTSREVASYLVARVKASKFKKLVPENIIEFENRLSEAGISFDLSRLEKTITPRQLQTFAKSLVDMTKEAMEKAK